MVKAQASAIVRPNIGRSPSFSFGCASACSSEGLGLPGLGIFVGHELQEVAGLALQDAADGLQGGKPQALHLAGFEQGEIGLGDPNGAGQHVGAHLAPGHHYVQADDDGHQTNPSRSSSISRPACMTSAMTKTTAPRTSSCTAAMWAHILSIS